eukprot:CAMPEP_0168172982 /NCGR_PEP_ID=MMETSP0139_2-20121125/5601_1 /TAXON_ID=44445 /ORGANISM="Pseudo-nitzschia australis, Strain 10249 10 AB" /LENGTH=37 /DNA_ID= /DNA_START= /DNA_END= /DNA_ORIENTATION=
MTVKNATALVNSYAKKKKNSKWIVDPYAMKNPEALVQ